MEPGTKKCNGLIIFKGQCRFENSDKYVGTGEMEQKSLQRAQAFLPLTRGLQFNSVNDSRDFNPGVPTTTGSSTQKALDKSSLFLILLGLPELRLLAWNFLIIKGIPNVMLWIA